MLSIIEVQQTNNNTMRIKLLIGFFSLFLFTGLQAQNEEAKSRKELRKERKEAERKLYAEQQAKALEMLKNKEFVLEADIIVSNDGGNVAVEPVLNFLAITDDQIHLQLGSALQIGFTGVPRSQAFSSGRNGVGGLTLRGEASKYEIDYDEKRNDIRVRITYSSTVGRDFINITLDVFGDRSFAKINTMGKVVTMKGYHKTLEETTVFAADNIRDN